MLILQRFYDNAFAYTSSTSSTTVFQSKLLERMEPACDRDWRRAGSSMSSVMRRAQSFASRLTNNAALLPYSVTALNASRSEAMTGQPAAIASANTMPKLSPPVCGATYMLNER